MTKAFIALFGVNRKSPSMVLEPSPALHGWPFMTPQSNALQTEPFTHTSLLDDHSDLEPPDPIPNSVVKRISADGSVGFPHVRVGHCQASN